MKRSTLLMVTALAVCMTAAPAVHAEVAAGPPTVTQAVKFGTAPTVQELMKRAAPVPQAYGAEQEVPILLPDSLKGRPPVETTVDPVAQRMPVGQAPAASLSFGGYDSDDNASQFGFRIMPPDTEGDVGLAHYVQYNNLGWKYFDKAGALQGGPFPGNIFWAGFGGVCETDNAGDPIVLYDQFADRWVFSQFTSPSNPDGHQCFAVTQGNDPAGPYFLYDFVVSPGQFNDYEKIGVWTDGAGQSAYHMTSNEFAGSFVGVNVNAFDRDKMLAGDPSASFIQFSLGTSTGSQSNFSLQPSHLEGNDLPPAGTCNEYIMAFDDETWGIGGPDGPDGYRFWTFCVDFAAPSNSTFSAGPFVSGPTFDSELCGFSRDCIPQPGTSQRLDTLGQFTMYRFATRYFPGQGLRGAISHTVDSGGNIAGVRWAEIDVDNHTILDTGTFAPGDGISRWMPSISIDGVGNLGVVFTKSGQGSGGAVCGNGICEAGNGEDCVSCAADCNGRQNGRPGNRFCCGDGDGQNPVPCSDSRCTTGGFQCTDTPVSGGTVRPSVYFTGRETTDPAGTLQAESVCIDGTGVQLGGNRWGDYATVSVDPDDDCTFWVTNEYVETTGSFQWDTQICAFSFDSCTGPAICGNNVIEGGEVCDGTDLGGETCISQGCSGGTLACSGTCDAFDTSGCTGCCLPKNASCTQNTQCCSGQCKRNGTCR